MTTIKELGQECRKLADEGKRLNRGEAILFRNSLLLGNLGQCEKLIETLKMRKPE